MKKICSLFILASVLFTLACKPKQETIKIKGSDTEVNLTVELAESFYKQNDHYSLAVSGGGSGLGIASLYNGQADIANSSRPLSEEEMRLFKEKGIEVKTHVFAEDATAIVVNSAIPITEIDVQTLAKLLSGEIDSWQTITGQDLQVNIYGRQNSSGTHTFIQKKLNIKFSPEAKEMNGNAQILEGIKVDPSGIGYVGAGYLLNQSGKASPVKTLKIKENAISTAYSPLDHEAIRNKKYFFQRPLFQFIPVGSWKKVQDFIAFERSATGKDIIRRSGYYVVE